MYILALLRTQLISSNLMHDHSDESLILLSYMGICITENVLLSFSASSSQSRLLPIGKCGQRCRLDTQQTLLWYLWVTKADTSQNFALKIDQSHRP